MGLVARPRPWRASLALLCLALVALLGLPAPIAAAQQAPQTELERLLDIADQQLGDRWVFAATGPNQFDCSGFVFYVFREAGLLDRIGGKRRTVAGYHNWFNNHGTVTKDPAGAQPGDVLVWGANKHTGIYLGNGWAISALINPYGVKVHRIDKIRLRVSAVLHVSLER